MCQAYEGEQDYLYARDKSIRQAGYNAQKAGVPRDKNPERDHTNPEYSDKLQWWLGWDTAAKGHKAW